MSPKLARPVGLCVALTAPALFLRLTGVHTPAALGLLAFGAAVVAASFLLAWAAEAARVDIAGPLAIAILAVIAVLPEYAVDLYFSYTAGHKPDYVQYAAANMTGSNRLLLGLGWPVVVIISLWVASRRSGRSVRELVLQSGYRTELGFLFIASIVAFLIPLSGQISLVLGFALLGFFVFYLWKASRAEASEPDLVGAAARIGGLSQRPRRLLVTGLFVFAAGVIVASAEPFAESLITTGTQLGIDRFLLVQWVAPLASEAPEFIVAILFAVHGKGSDAIGTLISSKVNQWTLLVGSLPLAYLAGGGGTALPLDGLAGRGVPADRYPGAARGGRAADPALPALAGLHPARAVRRAVRLPRPGRPLPAVRHLRRHRPGRADPQPPADPARPGRPVPHSARPLSGASPRARARGRAAAQSEPVEDLSDLPADASDAAAGCSPPRTRS